MVLKRNDGGLVEVHDSGKIRFRPTKFNRALGNDVGKEYRRRLEQIIPEAMQMDYPSVPADQAARVAPAMLKLVREMIDRVER
jgi:hypothetical protein